MAEGRETLRRTAGIPARFREEEIESTKTRKFKKASFLSTSKSLKSRPVSSGRPARPTSSAHSTTQRTQRKGFFPKTQKSRRGLTSILEYIYGDKLMDSLASQKINLEKLWNIFYPTPNVTQLLDPSSTTRKKVKPLNDPRRPNAGYVA